MSEATICRTCLRLRQDLCDGEKGQTACQWYKRMTNADRIRAMTDEELAYALRCQPEQLPPDGENCTEYNCYLCTIDWLRQEVSDNG